MHMADALLSPAVGMGMWAVSAGTITYCAKRVRQEGDERKVPLMGVLGAFLFAAQMINFAIPATGSSGHLGGGLLLAILLGPSAAFLTIASVLIVQSLFFADGGLLALGCNMFNMGFIPAFIVYPLIYRRIIGPDPGRVRMNAAIMISAIASLQLGPFCVVLETCFSGVSAIPFSTFLLFMQPIHLAIGVVEGVVTVAVVSFVRHARPDIIEADRQARSMGAHPVRTMAVVFGSSAIILGSIGFLYTSKNPDGLEWAIARVTGKEALKNPEHGVRGALAALQERTAILPGYSFRKPPDVRHEGMKPAGDGKRDDARDPGTGVAGMLGVLITLVLVLLGGALLKQGNHAA